METEAREVLRGFQGTTLLHSQESSAEVCSVVVSDNDVAG